MLPGLSATILNLTVALAQVAYDGSKGFNSSRFPGDLLFYTENCDVFQPIIYVYEQDGGLYVVARGSWDAADFLTDAEFDVLSIEQGTFHGGFGKAALWVWSQVEKYVENFEGPIYFTGHSYGGSVSHVAHVIAGSKYPNKTIFSYGYGAVPSMEMETSKPFADSMFSFVNDNDVFPRVSIPNYYERVKNLGPVVSQIRTNIITKHLTGALEAVGHSGLREDAYYQMLRKALPQIAQCVKNYEVGNATYVRFIGGQVFHVDSTTPKGLSECLVEDVAKSIGYVQLTVDCIDDHGIDEYVSAIEHLIW